MAFCFTEEQKKVINLRDRNILVSAAAGSGKTAVLTERIVSMITDAKKPVDIDRLLVVTFTNAAAAEMRERIRLAVEKRIDEQPENEFLQKQATLIHNAQITTIDSFCLFIIRNHFNEIGLDPAFRIADDGEIRMLQRDVLQVLLEEKFQQGDESFLCCVESYAPGGNDKKLEEYILKLYDFAMSYPFPKEWLCACKEDYAPSHKDQFSNAAWMSYVLVHIRKTTADCKSYLEEAVSVCEEADGPYMYTELLEHELEMIAAFERSETYEQYYENVQRVIFQRLPSKKDDSVVMYKRDIVKDIRATVKEMIAQLKERYFFTSPEQAFRDITESFCAVQGLVDVTAEFMEAFIAKKREKNVIDFSDMEHLALQILLDKKDAVIVPSQTAKAYQEYFEEILIDEYQDSNYVQEYLLKSVSKEGSGINNRFMVGDVKQSIYKFRLARPEIFMEKYETYTDEEADKQRVLLHKNFRSRGEVLDSINYMFYQLMDNAVGGITYDTKTALYMGSAYEAHKQDYRTELLLMEQAEENSQLSKRESEVRMIGLKIKELVGNYLISDKETGKVRSAEYRDIVILLRSLSGYDEEFKRVFEKEGIPVFVTSKTGYFSTIEIQVLLNFLRVLDNPLQDVALCAVLKIPMFGFSEEDLAIVKSTDKKSSLYDSLRAYQCAGEDNALKEKIEASITLITYYREKVKYLPIHEILQIFLYETGYLYYVCAMPAGEQRKANVEMLLEKAMDFEKTSYRGLFHFIRYIEQLEKYDVDYGEAGIVGENANTIRIMSIHKSKGLEFPICFVAGLDRRFHMQDIRSSLLMDMELGIGTDYMNPTARTKMPTLKKNAVMFKTKTENMGEELRVLYVAMTRAKEKLFLSASLYTIESKLPLIMRAAKRKETKLPFSNIMQASSYLDLVLSAMAKHTQCGKLFEIAGLPKCSAGLLELQEADILINIMSTNDLLEAKLKDDIRKEVRKEKLNSLEQGIFLEKEKSNQLQEVFDYRYAYSSLGKMYTKTTVSEIKKAAYIENMESPFSIYEEEEIIPYIPKFINNETKISGAARGNVYHKVMELLDFKTWNQNDNSAEIIEKLIESNKLRKEDCELLQSEHMDCFLVSPLAKRMMQADRRSQLHKEQPFVLGVSALELNPEFPAEETVLVQGIIDVYFEEDGELVVADYKTDKVKYGDQLISRYKTQLDYYAKALEQLTGKKVKEKIIYSFALMEEIKL